MPLVEFGVWAPDQPVISAPHLRTAKNCVPAIGHYLPLPGLTAVSAAMTARCRGAVGVRDINGDARLYGGDSTKLYRLDGSAWTDFSRGAGYGPAVDATRWRFATYGDRLIAVNGLDEPQYLDMSTLATSFEDLAGGPPIAQFVASYGEFVFLASTNASSMLLKWSGFGDSEGWTPGTNQSDEQEFADGGRITGLVSTKAALFVFQEKCIRRVIYIGGPTILQIDKIVDGIGCVEPNSLRAYGQIMFFLDESGLFMWDGESQPQPIGVGVVDEWFLSDTARTEWDMMSAAIDPRRKVAAWSYVSTQSGGDTPDTVLLYNYAAQRFAYARFPHEFLFGGMTAGTSLDDLDADYPDIDAMTVSLDDPIFQGGAFFLAAFTTEHKLASFTGANLEATFETGSFPLLDGRRAVIEWVKPVVTGDVSGAVTAAAGAAVRSGDAITFPSGVAQQASGRCPQRGANGFYSAARIVAPAAATWTAAVGLEFKANQAGAR